MTRAAAPWCSRGSGRKSGIHAQSIQRPDVVRSGLASIDRVAPVLRLVAKRDGCCELMADRRVEAGHVLDSAVVGRAVEILSIHLRRLRIDWRQAVIGHVVVVQQQRRQGDLGRSADAEAQ